LLESLSDANLKRQGLGEGVCFDVIERQGVMGVAKTAKSLIIASVEAYSGKSATILGAAHQFQKKGLTLSYTKPVGNYFHQENAGFTGEPEDLHGGGPEIRAYGAFPPPGHEPVQYHLLFHLT